MPGRKVWADFVCVGVKGRYTFFQCPYCPFKPCARSDDAVDKKSVVCGRHFWGADPCPSRPSWDERGIPRSVRGVQRLSPTTHTTENGSANNDGYAGHSAAQATPDSSTAGMCTQLSPSGSAASSTPTQAASTFAGKSTDSEVTSSGVPVGLPVNGTMATRPSHEMVVQLMQRVRSTRARAPQGTAADVAYVLCAAPSMFPDINSFQCGELMQAFLARPKNTLAKTARTVLFPDARSRELACPVLMALVEILDSIFAGRNWERSVLQFDGTQAVMSVTQFIAELRLAHPEQHAPTAMQREASVLAQYRELHDVFIDCPCVSTAHVHKFFRGDLCQGSEQTTLERSGPECWLALCELMGYPVKPVAEYGGSFCVDHIVERSLYTTRGRDKLTVADTLSNYAMLLDFFNGQGRMKVFGMEKRGWYGEKWADMTKTAMRFRLDFAEDHGRRPTVAEFTASTWCKDAWQPTSTLLKHTHPVHTRKRKAQGHMDEFLGRKKGV
eukprot:3143724-Prymnesium_polylepis.1